MKVQGATSSSQASEVKKNRKASSSSQAFSTGSAQETTKATGLFRVADVVAPDALLSLQEALTLSPEDRQSIDVGHRLLDDLEDIHKGVLLGQFSKASLENLLDRINTSRQKATHPEIENLIEQIELRAEVELAKLSYEKEQRD